MDTRVLVAGGYGAVLLLCWLVPPLATLHYPAGVVWAVTAFVGSGVLAVRQFAGPAPSLPAATATAVALLGIPLAGLLLPGLWRSHCDLVAGAGYFVLFPLGSALFAVALAYWLTSRHTRYAVLRLLGIGSLVALLGPLYDMGGHPQFYTYNHVFGGVLAPIYDRFVPFRPGLIAFRGTTLLWAILLIARGAWIRHGLRTSTAIAGVGAMLLLGAAYSYADVLRINTSAGRIQRALGGHHATTHFDVYYAPDALDEATVARIGSDLEFERARVAYDLKAGAEAPTGIQVYLYPNAETRARLTGAHTTSVAPVWLATPQMHLLTTRYGSMPHEMAHLMARPYGLPGLHASWSVGLLEGWAVALEAPTRHPPPHDQVLAATPPGDLDTRAQMVQSRWTPWGFWTAPGGVSYTVFGSFVTEIARAHGHRAIARAYARADVSRTTGCSVEALAANWLDTLRAQPQVSIDARPVAQRRFRRPGFFELACPYEPVTVQAQYEEARAALRRRDTTAARTALHAAIDAAPDFQAARRLLARLQVDAGAPARVRGTLGDSTGWAASDWALAAAADTAQGAWAAAADAYRRAEQAVPRAEIETRTRYIARAMDADAGATAAPQSGAQPVWQRRLDAFEAPLTSDTLHVRRHRDRALRALEDPSLPHGWRAVWTLRIHLGAVAAARRQRDAALLHDAACRARAVATSQNARPLRGVLTHAVRRAAWMQTGTPVAACHRTFASEP